MRPSVMEIDLAPSDVHFGIPDQHSFRKDDECRVQCAQRGTALDAWSRGLMFASSIAVLLLIAGPSFGQGQAPTIYPSQGQRLEQQSKDQGECRGWAQQQIGFNTAAGV